MKTTSEILERECFPATRWAGASSAYNAAQDQSKKFQRPYVICRCDDCEGFHIHAKPEPQPK